MHFYCVSTFHSEAPCGWVNLALQATGTGNKFSSQVFVKNYPGVGAFKHQLAGRVLRETIWSVLSYKDAKENKKLEVFGSIGLRILEELVL